MPKLRKSAWLFAVAGAMFIAGGAIQGNVMFLSIGAMFVALAFSGIASKRQ